MEERMDGIGYIDNLIENQRKGIAGLEKELETAKSELDALLKTRSIILKSRRNQNAKPLRDRFSSFSEFIRTFLDEENMSQSDFASLLGLSPHALSNWLGGGDSPQEEHRPDDECHLPAEAAVADAGGA